MNEQDYLIENNNSEFVTAEAVLKAARYVLARELAFDPHVRQSLRNTYHEHAEVSTYPTPKGKKEVDWYHAYFVSTPYFATILNVNVINARISTEYQEIGPETSQRIQKLGSVSDDSQSREGRLYQSRVFH